LVRGETDALHEALFFEINYHAAYEPMRAVRTGRWKYIKRFDGRSRPVLPNCDDGESKSLWMAHGWRDAATPEESLFDLIFDPNETNNLAKDERHRAVLAEMRDRLGKWMRETNDPLLAGPVPAPAGAAVNDPDGVSPTEKPRKVG
jgi:arylsulfatase A-like enzyme